MRKTIEQMREEVEMNALDYRLRLENARENETKKIERMRAAWNEIQQKYPDKIGYPIGFKKEAYGIRPEIIKKARIQLEKTEKVLEKELYQLRMISEAYDNILDAPEMKEYIINLMKNVEIKKRLANRLDFLEKYGDHGDPIRNNIHFSEAENEEFEKYLKNPDNYEAPDWFKLKSDEERGEDNE